MKLVFIILFILTSNFSFGQSLVEAKYFKDVCDCMDTSKNKSNVEVMNCFETAFIPNLPLIVEEYHKIHRDTSYEGASKFAYNLMEQAMIDLVKECKTYFRLVDSNRYKYYSNLNTDSLKDELQTLNDKYAISKSDKQFNSKRASIFFKLHDYDSALNDLEIALQINPNDLASLYTKAWIFEMKGLYDQAIPLYTKVAELSKKKVFYMYLEIAKRKKNSL